MRIPSLRTTKIVFHQDNGGASLRWLNARWKMDRILWWDAEKRGKLSRTELHQQMVNESLVELLGNGTQVNSPKPDLTEEETAMRLFNAALRHYFFCAQVESGLFQQFTTPTQREKIRIDLEGSASIFNQT